MEHLRPLERRMHQMRDEGLTVEQIAARIGHSPDHTRRIFQWMTIPRKHPPARRSPRPIESRVLALRARGESHEEVAVRFRRGPAFIRQVEGLAHYRMGLQLLEAPREGTAT